ncbi:MULTISPECIES: hypothetical protein [unclassified Erwinia]|nr:MULTISPECIES: hypothetical protein [unclassified Erwinia]
MLWLVSSIQVGALSFISLMSLVLRPDKAAGDASNWLNLMYNAGF